MGVFSNADEGFIYIDHYCVHCQNYELESESPGCPVMDLHIWYGYSAKEEMQKALNHFIPRVKDKRGFDDNGECVMFHRIGALGQSRLRAPKKPDLESTLKVFKEK